MKKSIALFLSLVLLISAACVSFAVAEGADKSARPPFVRDTTKVVSVFLAGEAQPLKHTDDSDPEMIDSVWVYYDNDTFVQFAELNRTFEYFSEGTYSFGNGGSFVIADDNKEGTITINRAKKHSTQEGRMIEYISSHEYVLGTLGFRQLYGPTTDKELVALFCDTYSFPYTDENGVTSNLDTFSLFYGDGSFEVVAILGKDVIDVYSGTYAFDEAGDFVIPYGETESGKLTLTITEDKMDRLPDSITYDFAGIGFKPLFIKAPETLK